MSKSNNTYHPLYKNPDKSDERTAYISHQLRKGKIGEKELFGIKLFNDYKLCPKDEKEIMLMY